MILIWGHIKVFGRREAAVDGVPANKVLDIRVEPSGVDAAADLIQYGQDNGVTVIIKEF